MTTELQFAVIKDELTVIKNMTKPKLKIGAMVFLMKSLKLYINNKEDSNLYALALSSKKDMLQ